MKQGNYVYYKDSFNEYIFMVLRDAENDGHDSLLIKIISCSTESYNGYEYILSYKALVRDCKETKVITEAEALAKVL